MTRFEAKSTRLVNKKTGYEYEGRMVTNTMSHVLLSNSKLRSFLIEVDKVLTRIVDEVKHIKFQRNPMINSHKDIV